MVNNNSYNFQINDVFSRISFYGDNWNIVDD